MPQQKLDVTLWAKMCRPEPLVPVSLCGEHVPYKNLSCGRLADKFKPLIQRGLLYLEDFIVIHNELHVSCGNRKGLTEPVELRGSVKHLNGSCSIL
jgi:hypothetical protein